MLAAMPPTSPTPANRDEAPSRADEVPSRASVPYLVRAPVREGGDACPGALRLHAADDGRLARLRLPGGLLTCRQAETLANAAERLGDGHVDITSRGNVQLRGLGADADCGAELAELLHEAGLLPSERHERVRNIVASPLAGLDGFGSGGGDAGGGVRADVRGDVRGDGLGVGQPQLWAQELDELLCASEAATALSGRFLFALDDGRGDVAALGADVTLLARRDGTAIVRIGANRQGLRVKAADAPRAALLAAETFLTVAEAGGSGAWRVRELPPGHELDAAVASRLTRAGIAYVTEPRVGEGEGEPPLPGLIHSSDGTVALSVHAPLGRLSAAQLRLLRSARGSTRDSTDPAAALRVTPWRGVIVPGLEPATADDLLKRLRIAGLITDHDSLWYGVGACTGRPGCAKALADVRADATEALRCPTAGRDALPLPVYWSGCERRCGHPQGARVDVVATAEGGYRVTVRGRVPTAAVTAAATSTATAGVTADIAVTAPGPELADAVATARMTTVTR
ncbi:cobalamin biosynthesis protein CobG [Streptomyces sp. NPDC059479]|uniref:cobalamin biosynthesis protein CobG n=1 Tax=Streptomyces sp. NPDC059479 TaxID=3346848 RepID=UPI0036810725